MKTIQITALEDRRRQIKLRWEQLLEAERASSSLANPKVMARMFDFTLDELFTRLRGRPIPGGMRAAPDFRRMHLTCSCGHNPFFAYFVAAEHALLEALLAVPDGLFSEDRASVAELYAHTRSLARSEIGTFCSICPKSGYSPLQAVRTPVDVPRGKMRHPSDLQAATA